MSALDGRWNCAVDAPIGRQEFVLTVRTSGDRFAGSAAGSIGSMDIPDGTVDGQTLSWAMKVTTPMSLTLNCQATISGDTLEGKVGVGIFGSFPITGTRE